MTIAIKIKNLCKTYNSYGQKFEALTNINLEIKKGEIFALLGPNGAGKTTLIGSICGPVNPTSGNIEICGYDIKKDYRKTRSLIGLVPQELTTDSFVSIWDTVSFSRGLFGKPKNDKHVASTIKRLSLWDKRNNKIMTLSGGMKRRVMIAKALSHEPQILFLDEPTAGVDVELRKSMWEEVMALKESGVTIILTTHYIEEAEEMADTIGVIDKGKLLLTEKKDCLIKKLGTKKLIFTLNQTLNEIPDLLKRYSLELSSDKKSLIYTYDNHQKINNVEEIVYNLKETGISFHDINSEQSTLEEIFVNLLKVK